MKVKRQVRDPEGFRVITTANQIYLESAKLEESLEDIIELPKNDRDIVKAMQLIEGLRKLGQQMAELNKTVIESPRSTEEQKNKLREFDRKMQEWLAKYEREILS